ncbi:MAG: hypothetical protein EOM08_00035 [Clostridia bacterium]|nr:hypothetical protein [Clostridia bacterium]NCC74812.1 hypothetical protein [Clostridia bacterium]
MLVDWFTILAQVANFLILVFLLKRFLFAPVLKAIDERENKIAHSIRSAEATMQDAEKTRDLYQEKLEDLERQKAERMQELAEQIELERQRRLAWVKSEAESESDRFRTARQTEADEFAQAFKHQLGRVVMQALERTLQDLSSQSLEQRMVERLAEKLVAHGTKDWRPPVPEGEGDPQVSIRVASTWSLLPQQRQVLESALESVWPGKGVIEYETDSSRICGLSLNWGGLQLDWSVEDYLVSLHECLDVLVTVPESKAEEQEHQP